MTRTKKNRIATVAALLVLGTLHGCGGGGGGSGGVGIPLLPPVPGASQPPAPPPPPPAPGPNREPMPGSEPLPSLNSPQAGSTAAVGNDSEGIYASLLDITLIGADGSIASKDNIGTLWGSLDITGLD